MTVLQHADPIFSTEWREEVRAFLAPFKKDVPPTSDNYRISIVRESLKSRSRPVHFRATVRFGDLFVELEKLAYFGEEEQTGLTVIYARKSGLRSSLEFWAYAMLLFGSVRNCTRPTNSVAFDFEQERQSQLLRTLDFRNATKEQWPADKYALPTILEEPILEAWQDGDKDSEWFAWAETSDSFVMWCWQQFPSSATESKSYPHIECNLPPSRE